MRLERREERGGGGCDEGEEGGGGGGGLELNIRGGTLGWRVREKR